jgi:ribosomal-protein-alanine N-acetyltransferase
MIRRMEISDLDAVEKIAAGLPHAPHWSRAIYLEAIDAEPRRIALVSVEKSVVGFVIAALVPPQAEIETISVDAGFQRRGVARQLYFALAAELEKLGVSEVQLEVRESNRVAQDFYRSLGFKENGCRPRYYADPEENARLFHVEHLGKT